MTPGYALPCAIEGCGVSVGPKGARGWCTRHYQRWLATGSPMGTLRLSEIERFTAKIHPRGECWEWTAAVDDSGYALFKGDRIIRGHIWAYEHFIGPVPIGLQLDHLCHTPECVRGVTCPHRRCVNPWHCEPVPPLVNSQRGRGARRLACPAKHPYTPENTYINPKGAQVCRSCAADSRARYQRKQRTT